MAFGSTRLGPVPERAQVNMTCEGAKEGVGKTNRMLRGAGAPDERMGGIPALILSLVALPGIGILHAVGR